MGADASRSDGAAPGTAPGGAPQIVGHPYARGLCSSVGTSIRISHCLTATAFLLQGAAREKQEAAKESAVNRLAQKIAESPNPEVQVSAAAVASALPILGSGAGSTSSGAAFSLTNTQPRYTITVVDAKGKRANGAHSCGVLLVPQGTCPAACISMLCCIESASVDVYPTRACVCVLVHVCRP